MNAPAKINPPANTAIWDAVSKTDPAHTKKVNQRGGFTAISAHYQVMRATEQFGPVGIGWGYENGEPIWHDSLVIVPVTVWHGARENSFGPVFGGAEWKNGNRLDSDAPKKAATDGLTKALSHLGFNADVFLGRFDDNKYVAEVAREFAAASEGQGQSEDRKVSPAPKRENWGGTYPNKTALHRGLTAHQRDLEGCGDLSMLDALTATKEWREFVATAEEHAPHYLYGGEPAPEEFKGLLVQAKQMRDEFNLQTANHMVDLANT